MLELIIDQCYSLLFNLHSRPDHSFKITSVQCIKDSLSISYQMKCLIKDNWEYFNDLSILQNFYGKSGMMEAKFSGPFRKIKAAYLAPQRVLLELMSW